MQRILVIRGGAIGDFVLTLPGLRAVRERYPRAHIEILGHKQITALAEHRFYADATRSIDDALPSLLFVGGSTLPPTVRKYFATFDVVISYLSDRQRIVEENIMRCGLRRYLAALPRASGADARSAAEQLSDSLRQIGINVTNFAAKLYPSQRDRQVARELLSSLPKPLVAIHPGSGSPQKNWPIENWSQLGADLLDGRICRSLIVVTGEADRSQLAHLQSAWRGQNVHFAAGRPLPELAAMIERCSVFIGHDSGISHIAAAVGTSSLLLFGPTDPQIWAPQNGNVTIVRSQTGKLDDLPVEQILRAAQRQLATN